MSDFQPFADDSASTSIGGLTIENGRDRLALYGSVDITRDAQGLAHARSLAALFAHAVAALEATSGLPAAVPKPVAARSVRNPFG